MRLFVTGVGGQLGSEICTLSKHENFGTYLKEHENLSNTEYIKLDVTKREKVFDTIKKIRPDWIIHCAAITDIDLCEEQNKVAWLVNVEGTKNIIDTSKIVGANVLYVSTDYIFDGRQGMYKENDKPNPLNYYGKTKLEGERIVQSLSRFIIVRSAVIYSRNKPNFVLWVLDKLKSGEVSIVTDQTNSPTLSTDLADSILKLIEKDVTGVYHAAGDDRISRYDFAIKIAEAFDFDKRLIVPIKTVQLNQKALRPRDSSLDTSKIKSLGITFSNINDALKKLKRQMEMKLE